MFDAGAILNQTCVRCQRIWYGYSNWCLPSRSQT